MDWHDLVQKPTTQDIETQAYRGNPEWVLSDRGHEQLDRRVKVLLKAYKKGRIDDTAVYSDIGEIVARMEKQGAVAVAQYLCNPIEGHDDSD